MYPANLKTIFHYLMNGNLSGDVEWGVEGKSRKDREKGAA
jgi:hypothetical protein